MTHHGDILNSVVNIDTDTGNEMGNKISPIKSEKVNILTSLIFEHPPCRPKVINGNTVPPAVVKLPQLHELISSCVSYREVIHELISSCVSCREVIHELISSCLSYREVIHELISSCVSYREVIHELISSCVSYGEVIHELISSCVSYREVIQPHVRLKSRLTQNTSARQTLNCDNEI